jgi:DNA-binding MarR family transcriptional regulator
MEARTGVSRTGPFHRLQTLGMLPMLGNAPIRLTPAAPSRADRRSTLSCGCAQVHHTTAARGARRGGRERRTRQIDVSERTGIDRATTINVVRRLVRQGVLRRRRSQRDARVYVLKLTDQGRRLVDNAERVAGDIDAALTEALPPARPQPFLGSTGSLAG